MLIRKKEAGSPNNGLSYADYSINAGKQPCGLSSNLIIISAELSLLPVLIEVNSEKSLKLLVLRDFTLCLSAGLGLGAGSSPPSRPPSHMAEPVGRRGTARVSASTVIAEPGEDCPDARHRLCSTGQGPWPWKPDGVLLCLAPKWSVT